VAVSSEPYAVVEGAERPRKAESRSGGNPPRKGSISSPVDQQSPGFRLFGAKHSLTMQDNTVQRLILHDAYILFHLFMW
jgi:hypothetical protein